MASKIPHRNQSPHGWWIASYVERATWDDEPNPPPSKRCRAWENTIILKASNRNVAYKKAIKLGRLSSTTFSHNVSKRTGRWVFIGLTSLLPIYDKLEDGAEVLWVEHENRSVGKIRSMVKAKHELSVFDDTPPEYD